MLFLKKKINLNLYLLIFFLFFSNNLYPSIFDFNNKSFFDINDLDKHDYNYDNFLNFYKLNIEGMNFSINEFNLPLTEYDLNSYKCNIDYEDLVISLNINDLDNNSFLRLNSEEILINDNSNNLVSEETKYIYYLFKKYPEIDKTKIFVDSDVITIFYKNKNNLNEFELEYSDNFSIKEVTYFYLKHNIFNIYSSKCENIINIFDDNRENINKLYLSGNNLSFFKQINENINYYSLYNFYSKQHKVFFCNNLKNFKIHYFFTRLNNIDCYKDISSINLFISTKILDIIEYKDNIYLKLDYIKLNKIFRIIFFVTYLSIIYFIVLLLGKYLFSITKAKDYFSSLTFNQKLSMTFLIIYILYLIRIPILLDFVLFLIIMVILYKEINNFLKQ